LQRTSVYKHSLWEEVWSVFGVKNCPEKSGNQPGGGDCINIIGDIGHSAVFHFYSRATPYRAVVCCSTSTVVPVPRPIPPAAGSDGCVIIREVYENRLASEFFALQLDYALDAGAEVIVIEPSQLGRETSQWLAIGSGLRRSALATWSASVVAATLWLDRLCLLGGVAAVAMATVYAVSWRPDPCSAYRVEQNLRRLQALPLRDVACTTPVVLVRRRHSRLRGGIYGSVAAVTVAGAGWRLYRGHLI